MDSTSVIIPTYNYASYLSLAIESVLTQAAAPAELIVVDDGSTDGTADVLARFGNRVHFLKQSNTGVSAARNRGASVARGNLLAFLDADDIWLPHKLERQLARFQSEPDLGLVHCGMEYIDAAGELTGQSCLDGLEGNVADEMLLFRRSVILGGGSGVLIPRAVFESVGGFDERLSTSADWDLYYRIALRHRVAFVPEVHLRYRRHGSNMHGNIRAMEHDMLIAYEKAFASDARPARFRRKCYGNLHAILAGSFLAAGQPLAGLGHAARGFLLTPGSIVRYLGLPLRRLRGWAGGSR